MTKCPNIDAKHGLQKKKKNQIKSNHVMIWNKLITNLILIQRLSPNRIQS